MEHPENESRSGGEQNHGKPDDEEAGARLEEFKKSVEFKMTLRQSNLNPEIPGVVQGWAAITMGLLSGSIPWYTMMVLHKKVWFLKQVDDTMAVFHTHAVAGSLGGILTGFFADPTLNRMFYNIPKESDAWKKYIGLAYGLHNGRTTAGFRQMGVQLLGILFVVCLNLVTTSIICLVIRLIVPLRLSEEELENGDDAIHGEEAYALWGDGEKFENSKHNSVYGMEEINTTRAQV